MQIYALFIVDGAHPSANGSRISREIHAKSLIKQYDSIDLYMSAMNDEFSNAIASYFKTLIYIRAPVTVYTY